MSGGALTGPPDYVGVGALETPVRWWHRALLEHPGVEASRAREREGPFFAGFWGRAFTDEDVAAYHARFPRGGGRIAGEWMERYVYEPWTPLLLRRAAPEARLLVLLRDPADVVRSKLVRQPYLRPRDEDHGMGDATARGRYAAQLRNLWAHVERERTLVLQYERCRRDPLGEYVRMLRFLGLRDDFVPRRFEAPEDPLAAPSPYRRARRALGVARRRLRGLPAPPAPVRPDAAQLWPDLEHAMLADLTGDVAELVQLVEGLDLRLWPRFAHLAPDAGG